jgi:hypothetical protein
MKIWLLFAGVLACSPGAAPVSSSPKDPSNPNAPEGAQPPAALESQPAATVYTCPMHPEVVSDKPGKCPKCGMTLVAKTAS